jgi:hypothetical protein
MSPRVVVIDDEEQFRAAWARSIQAVAADEWDVTTLPNEELLASMTTLEQRRIAARERRASAWTETAFDTAAILVIDYDLAPISDFGTLTGEAVAYLARAYSRVGYIVLLNAVSEAYFDLTLRGEAESFADLVIGSRHVGSIGLWSRDVSGFRPWQWPSIPAAARSLGEFANVLVPRLDDPILSVLELQHVALGRGVRSLVDAGSRASGPTIREFVESGPTGLRRKDLVVDDHAAARIAAARLRRWIEFDVLSSEDILVDAPHLVARFPSLLTGDPGDLDSWNQTAHPGPGDGLDVDLLTPHLYPLSSFLSRDVWYWKRIQVDKRIEEVREPFAPRPTPFAFCEDLSRFLPLSDVREFVGDLAGDYIRRYMVDTDTEGGALYQADLDGVELRPMSRLSSG